MIRVALTHDIDRIHKTYQYLTRAYRSCKSMNFSAAIKELQQIDKKISVYWNFEDIMESEDRLGVRSTFFFLNESIRFQLLKPSTWKLSLGRYDINSEKITNIIKNLDENGWEIGLHGSFNSYTDANLLIREKKELELIVGHEVKGVRQHYLNWNDKTWEYQHNAGFKYDSSLGFTYKIGYYNQITSPFKHKGGGPIEFPLAIMDICYFKTKHRSEALRRIIKQTEMSNGVLVINWHGDNWNEQEFPDYKKAYVDIVKSLVHQNAVFKTLSEFYKDYQSIEIPTRTMNKNDRR